MKARTVTLVACLLLLPALGSTRAQEPPEPPDDLAPNIRVTLTIGDSDEQSGFRERNYRTVARPRQSTELMMGWRTPIPAKRKEITAEGEVPITSYTYQNVGVTGQFDIDLVDGQILMRLQVEVSGPKEGPAAAVQAGAPPIIGTFQQHVVVLLTDGKPLRIAEVPDHEGGALYLEVLAEILD